MILPTIRASVSREDALHLVDLLGRHDAELRDAARQRLEEHGVDALLDDPRVRNALLTDPDVRASPAIVFFVLVRQALLEGGVDDPATADFVASLVMAFGRARAAYRPSDEDESEYFYLVDLLSRLRDADPHQAFLLRSHLGNFSLWLAGLFPDYLDTRCRRKGAPPIGYFDQLGASGYRRASQSPEAAALGVAQVMGNVGDDFVRVRFALNRVADRVLWPGAGDPVARFIRGVERGGA